MMRWFWRLVCRWRGHLEARFEPTRAISLRPGSIVEVPTPNLIRYMPLPPPLPQYRLDRLPAETQTRYAMQRANPPIILHRFYCERCGEAWS
jgi:hypothetical protein